ncbi:MAG TPA: hypothetical protein VLB44_05880 [Kofleriaceae bacterium]|nr:hypothetical protein [Kofleriaceae bacterium]
MPDNRNKKQKDRGTQQGGTKGPTKIEDEKDIEDREEDEITQRNPRLGDQGQHGRDRDR